MNDEWINNEEPGRAHRMMAQFRLICQAFRLLSACGEIFVAARSLAYMAGGVQALLVVCGSLGLCHLVNLFS